MPNSNSGLPVNAGDIVTVFPTATVGSLTPITSVNGTLNATFSIPIGTGAPAVIVQLDQSSGTTGGAIRFQVSYDGTNFINPAADASGGGSSAIVDPNSNPPFTSVVMPYTLVASTNQTFLIQLRGAQALQILVSTAVTGTISTTPFYSVLPFLPNQSVDITKIAGNGISWTFGSPTQVNASGLPALPANAAVYGLSTTANNLKAIGTAALGVAPTAGTFALTTNSQAIVMVSSTPTMVTGTGTSMNVTTVSGSVVSITANSSVNVNQIGGSAVSSAASGVQKVGIVGNTGATLDSTIGAATAPTNALATSVVYQSTIPALTAGQAVAQQGDTTGATYVNTEGRKKTYSTYQTFTAAAGVIAVLPGNASNTVRVLRVEVSISTTGTAAIETVSLIKTSAAPTSGTSAAMTVVPHDSGFAAASSAPLNYTVAPTPGTPVGTIRGVQFADSSTTALPGSNTWLWDWGMRPGTAIVLRGVAQTLEVNLGGVVATQTVTVSFEWTED